MSDNDVIVVNEVDNNVQQVDEKLPYDVLNLTDDEIRKIDEDFMNGDNINDLNLYEKKYKKRENRNVVLRVVGVVIIAVAIIAAIILSAVNDIKPTIFKSEQQQKIILSTVGTSIGVIGISGIITIIYGGIDDDKAQYQYRDEKNKLIEKNGRAVLPSEKIRKAKEELLQKQKEDKIKQYNEELQQKQEELIRQNPNYLESLLQQTSQQMQEQEQIKLETDIFNNENKYFDPKE